MCAIEFDNLMEGEHNKLLLVGYYGYNASYRPAEKALVCEMHKWIWDQKAAFRRNNPRAPVILAGDTNAATRTAIDTDSEAADDEMELDSCTIDHLEAMGLIGVGLTSVSMVPSAIGPVKAMLRTLDRQKLWTFMEPLLRSPLHTLRPELLEFAQRNGVAL